MTQTAPHHGGPKILDDPCAAVPVRESADAEGEFVQAAEGAALMPVAGPV